ncbi:MAG: two-component regulator propeller domain-containing protein, partial [Saprospiraceae bacterium]
MHQHFRLRISLFLFCLPILLSSCSGQVKTNPAQETIAKPISNQSDHPKISKTQGSDQYQNVHCGLQDRRGNLWFGTTGEGVYRFDGKQFIQYTEKDGLSSNTIWEMAEDNLGNL